MNRKSAESPNPREALFHRQAAKRAKPRQENFDLSAHRKTEFIRVLVSWTQLNTRPSRTSRRELERAGLSISKNRKNGELGARGALAVF